MFRKTWLGGFLFMLVMFVIQCFGTAGEGRIAQKEVDHRLRGGLSHYFLLDSGQRLRVPPEVYDLRQPQQMVRKRRFSASYQVNGVWYSAWGDYLPAMFILPTIVALGAALFGMKPE